jgi:type IV pilus assembly protein PilW
MGDRSAPRRLPLHAGLSLVELMVALVVALLFSLAVLQVQAVLTRQNMQLSDVTQRDDQARAALDIVTQDLSNAGFDYSGVQAQCNAILAYDAAGAMPGVIEQFPVAATAQTASTQLPTASSQPTVGPGSYVSAISNAPTSMVSIYVAQSALTTPQSNGAPAVYNVQNTVVLDSSGKNIGTSTNSGSISTGQLPLQSTADIASGSIGYLRLFLAPTSTFNYPMIGCVRIPVNATPSSNTITSSGSSLFPSGGYSAYTAQMRSDGLLGSSASLNNNSLLSSRIYYPFVSPTPSSTNPVPIQIVYYIGMSTPGAAAGAAGNYPELMRATINALNDQIIAQPTPVAAGIVSLQLLYGVDSTQTDPSDRSSNNIDKYLSWPDVVTKHLTNAVHSVLFTIVAKSLHSDPDPNKYSAPATIKIPQPSLSGSDTFTDYPVPTAYAHDHFSVLQSEVAVRNQLWLR